ncbi:porin OmpA [Tolumonas lignilytica]|jgi:Outer membrane protein and related peptidoglycan-associated (lipo)proteins|uniref:porin OmpA n=1 Tax=Tolumonas lignilytica TaxID=1283284 RepID=UPI000467D74A|nr:porin OmpA [Tolumonas lignilytica]
MKKAVVLSVIAGLVASAVSVSALANDAEGAFLGTGMGWNNYSDLGGLGTANKSSTPAVHVFGGYTFNEYFGVEEGYNWLGNGRVNGQRFKANGLNISALPRYPLTEDLSLLGEVGVMLWNTDNQDLQAKDHGYSPVFGAGLAYRVSDPVDLQLRYRYMNGLGDAQTGASDSSNVMFDVVYYPTRTSTPAPVVAPAPEPVAAPAPAPQPVVETKTFTLTSDVLFDFGKSTLKPAGVTALSKLYNQIQTLEMNDKNIVVYGYTDRIGSAGYNLKLSQDRAKSVSNFLTSKGLSATRITAVGRGKADPVSPASCNAVKAKKALIVCLAPDRRVNVEVKGTKKVTVK